MSDQDLPPLQDTAAPDSPGRRADAPVRIADMPEAERPREKLMRGGPESLTDAELLALFFGSGVVGMNVVELSRHMLQKYGNLTALSRAGVKELMRQKGIGEAKAIHLVAACELGRRLARERFGELPLETPEQITQFIGPELRMLKTETLRVIMLTTRLSYITMEEVGFGNVSDVNAQINVILRPVIVHSAGAFAVVHNHPSGDPTPSQADRSFTRRLKECADLMQLRLIDHIIIGHPSSSHPGGYFSFREVGLCV